MPSSRGKTYWPKVVVLAVFAFGIPIWLFAQHGSEMDEQSGSTDQEAQRQREIEASVHKGLDCSACHGESEMGFSKLDPVETCGDCHEQALRAYSSSVHGIAFDRGTPHTATCVECHGSHAVQAVRNPQAPVSRMLVSTQTCARCHDSVKLTAMHQLPADVVPDFRQSFHGLSAAIGDQRVANCASCHSYHEIRPSRDPLSTVNSRNLVQTCGACHAGATATFATGGVHHRPDTPGHNLVDIVRVMYLMMITVTIGLMLLHNGIDFWGRLRESLAHRAVPAGAESQAKRNRNIKFLRFTRNERLQHWTLAASFILLAVSGFALKYTWRIPGLEPQQGAIARGYVHRVAALAFILLAVYHVGYMSLTKRGRYNFRALVPKIRSVRDFVCRCAACIRFGPPSVPDWKNLIQTVKYNLGLATTRPAMGRFTYTEKMEYLGLIWGSGVMIVTGLILWFEVPFLNLFRYWVFDLATTVHYYEAVLATLSIIVWHFYYTIYNPSIFPVSKAMITGEIGREEMEREHELELHALEEDSLKHQPGRE